MNIELSFSNMIRGMFVATALMIGLEAGLYGVLMARTNLEARAAEMRIAALVAERG